MIPYRGTSSGQDSRFSNKDRKMINARTWPEIFDVKVNMKNVELGVIEPWIAKRITELIGMEDEVIINLTMSELQSPVYERGPDPKLISLNLTGIQIFIGFLSRNTTTFMSELWTLLVEAQNSPGGIPPSLVQEKKDEINARKQALLDQVNKLENIKQSMIKQTKSSNPQQEAYKQLEMANQEQQQIQMTFDEAYLSDYEANIQRNKHDKKKSKKSHRKDKKSKHRNRSESRSSSKKDRHKNKDKNENNQNNDISRSRSRDRKKHHKQKEHKKKNKYDNHKGGDTDLQSDSIKSSQSSSLY